MATLHAVVHMAESSARAKAAVAGRLYRTGVAINQDINAVKAKAGTLAEAGSRAVQDSLSDIKASLDSGSRKAQDSVTSLHQRLHDFCDGHRHSSSHKRSIAHQNYRHFCRFINTDKDDGGALPHVKHRVNQSHRRRHVGRQEARWKFRG